MNKIIIIVLLLLTFIAGASFFDKFSFFGIVDNAPDFDKITDTKTRKQEFFTYLKPIINEQNALILQLRNKIKNHKLSADFLGKLADKYRIDLTNIKSSKKLNEELLKKIDIIPTSLALAQAAIESNWGRSRFAKYNNYYGIWCFQKGCGVVPKNRDIGAKHEVATFRTINEATRKYIFNLNSHPAYAKLRDIRYNLRKQGLEVDGISLSNGLEKYSGIGIKYIDILKQMIIYNKL